MYVCRGGIPSAVPGGVRRNGFHQRLSKHKVMGRILGCPGEWCSAFDHVWKAHGPFVGLLGTHRSPNDERQALEAKLFSDEYMLSLHIVTNAHVGKIGHAVRKGRIVWRTGEPIANLIDDDDEVLV